MKSLGLTRGEMHAHRAENRRKRYAANPEHYRGKRNAFAAANREKINRDNALWREENRERLRDQQRAYAAANRESIRERARRNRPKYVYGIPEEAVLALLVHQGGRCAVCACPLTRRQADAGCDRKTAHIDHCHDTGAVRGLLCVQCNVAEGWIRKYGDRVKAYLAAPPAAEILRLA